MLSLFVFGAYVVTRKHAIYSVSDGIAAIIVLMPVRRCLAVCRIVSLACIPYIRLAAHVISVVYDGNNCRGINCSAAWRKKKKKAAMAASAAAAQRRQRKAGGISAAWRNQSGISSWRASIVSAAARSIVNSKEHNAATRHGIA